MTVCHMMAMCGYYGRLIWVDKLVLFYYNMMVTICLNCLLNCYWSTYPHHSPPPTPTTTSPQPPTHLQASQRQEVLSQSHRSQHWGTAQQQQVAVFVVSAPLDGALGPGGRGHPHPGAPPLCRAITTGLLQRQLRWWGVLAVLLC